MEKLYFKKEIMDTETGEIIEAVGFIPTKKDNDFVKVYKLFGEQVLKDLKTMNGETKLLLWFISKTLDLPVQSDLWIPVKYEELAKELNTTERTIKAYIKKLKELNYIEQFQKRVKVFRVNVNYIYKGKLVDYREKNKNINRIQN